MKCVYCGNDLPDKCRFCIFCGKQVQQPEKNSDASGEGVSPAPPAVFCTKCGAKILPGNKFCIYCGTKADIPESAVEKQDVSEAELALEIKGEEIAASYETMSGEGGSDDYDPASDETVLQPLSKIVLTNLDRPGFAYTAPILDEVGIGRKWGEILIKDDPELSRIHCRVVLKGGQLFLVDENSKNGTIYKNHRIPSGEETPVQSGDIIRMGKYSYYIELKAEC